MKSFKTNPVQRSLTPFVRLFFDWINCNRRCTSVNKQLEFAHRPINNTLIRFVMRSFDRFLSLSRLPSSAKFIKMSHFPTALKFVVLFFVIWEIEPIYYTQTLSKNKWPKVLLYTANWIINKNERPIRVGFNRNDVAIGVW